MSDPKDYPSMSDEEFRKAASGRQIPDNTNNAQAEGVMVWAGSTITDEQVEAGVEAWGKEYPCRCDADGYGNYPHRNSPQCYFHDGPEMVRIILEAAARVGNK